MRKKNRLLIISNRLPITIGKKDSKIDLQPSSGGVVSGLQAFYKNYNAVWLGWPGIVSEGDKKIVESELSSKFNYSPVFIPRELSEKYYEGCCNNTIWPLFHSFQGFAEYSESEWESYKKVNLLFCEKVAKIVRPGDVIWVHDYQLMMLPKYLRERFPDVPIGFFLHIPFPPFDIYRLLPHHKEIIESLLAADLVGFHTYDYAQAFLGSVRRELGYEGELGQITIGGRVARVDVFPLGIDFRKFSGYLSDKKKKITASKMYEQIAANKIIFSVSRLDYTKGIPQSIEAIGEFFERNPQWCGKVAYLLVVVPSREKVERYASLKREIDELVGKINSRYGTLDWLPIRYIYRSLSFAELIALYSKADVALVTPLRDGMNLIAKEYIATKTNEKGVLILSEMAGAAKEMIEALLVNPNSKEEVVQAIERALAMSDEEQIRRNKIMRSRLKDYDVKEWVERFLYQLAEAVNFSKALRVRKLGPERKASLVNHYSKASNRLLILDYDGTLTPFVDKPQKAKPSAKLIGLLKRLNSSTKNEVIILSGRDKKTLQRWFGALKMAMVAEHGAWVKGKKSKSWKPVVNVDDQWKKQIRPIMQLFVDRIPGSFIEEKDFSLVWHYRKTNVDIGAEAAREMVDTLINLTANLALNVLPGNKVVEIKVSEVSKGTFYLNYLADKKWDFVLAIGDDWTDESLFNVVPEGAYSIHVGPTNSNAKFNLESTQEVLSFLSELASSE